MKKISIVSPVFNEEEIIFDFYRELVKVLNKVKYEKEIIFINDGSSDNTKLRLDDIKRNNRKVSIITFSRNKGQQKAILAGIKASKSDAVCVIDSDLQDPPIYILEFLNKWEKGADIVYGKRVKREDSLFKRLTAFLFYRALNMFLKNKIYTDTGDFYLLNRKVIDELKKIDEKHLFLRGRIARMGFSSSEVGVKRKARSRGKSGYSLLKMMRLAKDAFISLSKEER